MTEHATLDENGQPRIEVAVLRVMAKDLMDSANMKSTFDYASDEYVKMAEAILWALDALDPPTLIQLDVDWRLWIEKVQVRVEHQTNRQWFDANTTEVGRVIVAAFLAGKGWNSGGVEPGDDA